MKSNGGKYVLSYNQWRLIKFKPANLRFGSEEGLTWIKEVVPSFEKLGYANLGRLGRIKYQRYDGNYPELEV